MASFSSEQQELMRQFLELCDAEPDLANPLHWAAGRGYVVLIRSLIKRAGYDVNSVAHNGLTPLHTAAANGQTNVVRELIGGGASKSVVAYTAGTPLHLAVANGHVDTVVAMLIAECPVDVVDTITGFTVMHAAAQCGCRAMLRILYKRCNLNAVDSMGRTSLHVAAQKGQTDFVTELLKLGANTSVVAGMLVTPLHQAVCAGHVKTVVAMLEQGCPPDAVDSVGCTVLHWAAEHGDAKMVRELVDRGCDMNALAANHCTPVHCAAACGKTEVVCEMIKLGAATSVVVGNYGTPLHQAASMGHLETVVAMLDEGCSSYTVNSNGISVLHCAAENGHAEVIRELVRRGCDVNIEDANGCTPLHFASLWGRTEAVRDLIELGTNKSIICSTSDNPLHEGVLNDHEDTNAVVLEKRPTQGAPQTAVLTDTSSLATDSVNSANCNGLTPLMLAFGGGHVGVCNSLVTHGANITAEDKHGWLAFEHCFVGGHASKLSQFSEACGIRCKGEGLRAALKTLITQGLVDACKVLCLCAISGDSVFLDSDFVELVTSDSCTLPMIVKYAKVYFSEGVTVLDRLNIPDNNALNPLQISLLSLKLNEMGQVPYPSCSDANARAAHTSFIEKLLSHPVLKCSTVNETFKSGLSPLDIAQQFELHDIAALIERVGGRPGMWADIPQEIELKHAGALSKLKEAYASMKTIAEDDEHGFELMKGLFSSILERQTVDCVVHVADDSRLVKEEVLGQHPDLGDVVTHVLPHIQMRHWKRVGLALGMKKSMLDDLGQEFSNDDERYLETLSCWLERDSSVTWKTLLGVLRDIETKNTMDRMIDNIVSLLGGAHRPVAVTRPVTKSAPVVNGGLMAMERSPPKCKDSLLRSKPTMLELLHHVVLRVAARWYVFGLALGVEDYLLDAIKATEKGDVEACCTEMLKRWLRGEQATGGEERSWSTVLNAVQRYLGQKAYESIAQALEAAL